MLLLCVRYIAPGSYVYAEMYEFNVPEESLIAAFKNLKITSPEYIVPDTVYKDEQSDYWFQFYFYYPEKKQIVHFWTRPRERKLTEVGFVGINDGLQLGNWKTVNEDYSRKENKAVKREFQKRILDKLKLHYENKGNGMKILGIQL